MANEVKMGLLGIDELISEVEKLGQKGSRIENTALREAGEVVREAIENEAPEDSGDLKESIAVSRVKTKDGVKHVEIGPDKDGFYGKFVEFGTVKQKANPFMSRGYEKSKENASNKVEDELRKGLGL